METFLELLQQFPSVLYSSRSCSRSLSAKASGAPEPLWEVCCKYWFQGLDPADSERKSGVHMGTCNFGKPIDD